MENFSLFYEDIPWNAKELFRPTKRLPKMPEPGSIRKRLKGVLKHIKK